jgi:LCP family protein required for cell wall assembly
VVPGSSFFHFLGRFAIALVLVLVTAAVVVARADYWVREKAEDIPEVHIREEVLEPVDNGEPANFLVIGTDSRNFVANEEQARAFGSESEVGGERSDAIMVVHVDPDLKEGFVVSFPRDLWVTIPDHGEGRINAAIGYGGPELVIETLKANYDVPITHYLEVDFAGFEKIVDTIGGVDIYFPTPARDGITRNGQFASLSGLDIPEAGCRELNGQQALQYVRSRHYQWYDAEDETWRTDPRSDLSRIERQQYFIRSLAQAALDQGAGDVTTAMELLDDIADALKRDQNLEFSDLRGLINAFRRVDPAKIKMYTVPVVSVDEGGASVLVPDQAASEPLFSSLRTFAIPDVALPATAAPAEVHMAVENGTGANDRGDEVVYAFTAHGYDVVGPATEADGSDYDETQVLWRRGKDAEGVAVASSLRTLNGAVATEPLPAGVDVLVIVGRDWDELPAAVKLPPVTEPTGAESPGPPETSATTIATTTTTTVPSPAATAVVPVDPDTGGSLVGCP